MATYDSVDSAIFTGAPTGISAFILVFMAEAIMNQANALKYAAEVYAYVKLKAQAEEAYQNALKARDDKARPYLLYLLISASVFVILAFASLVIAASLRNEKQENPKEPQSL